MSAEEGEVSEGELDAKDGLESGEESEPEDKTAPRPTPRSRGHPPLPRHPLPGSRAGGRTRDYDGRDRWSRHAPVRRGVNTRPVDRGGPQNDPDKRRDMPGDWPRRGRPAPSPSVDSSRRSESRGPGHGHKAGNKLPSLEGGNRSSEQMREAKVPHSVQLRTLQDIITIDTVCVSAARDSLQQMCGVVQRGLTLLAEVWEADRRRHRVSVLYSYPDWDAIRDRLLQGLRAIHLVCSAGLASTEGDLKMGLETMQQACSVSAALTNLQKQMPEVVAWQDSLRKVQVSARALSPQPGATATTTSKDPSEENPADGKRQRAAAAVTESPVTRDSGPASDLQAEGEDADSKAGPGVQNEKPATTFVPRVKFRLDLKGPSGVEVLRPANRTSSPEVVTPSEPPESADALPPPPPPPPPVPAPPACQAEALDSQKRPASSLAHRATNGAAVEPSGERGALRGTAQVSVNSAEFAESSLSSSQDSDDRLMPLGASAASGVPLGVSATAAAIAAAVRGAIASPGVEVEAPPPLPEMDAMHQHQPGSASTVKASTGQEVDETPPAPRRSRWDLGAAATAEPAAHSASPPPRTRRPSSPSLRRTLASDLPRSPRAQSPHKRIRSPVNGAADGRNRHRKLSRRWQSTTAEATLSGGAVHASGDRDGRHHWSPEPGGGHEAAASSLREPREVLAERHSMADRRREPAAAARLASNAHGYDRVQANAGRGRMNEEHEAEAKCIATALPLMIGTSQKPRHVAMVKEEPVKPPCAEPPPPLPPSGKPTIAPFDVEMSPVTSEEAPDFCEPVPAPQRPPQAPSRVCAVPGTKLRHELEEEPLTPPDSPLSSAQHGSAGPSATTWPQVPSSEAALGHDAQMLTPTSPASGSPAPPLPTFSPPPAPPSPPHETPSAAPPLAAVPAAPPIAEERPLHSLISSGLLALVVNLEGTLIDIVKPSSVTKWSSDHQHRLRTAAASAPSATSGLFQLTASRLWIKLRPGWHATLHRLSCFYCLWLVTELSAPIVAEIQQIIDPQQLLFGGRVTAGSAVLEDTPARGGGPAKKRPVRHLQHLRGLKGLRPVTLVLDNRQQMLWHSADSAHVVHCERYPFFPRVSQGVTNASLLVLQRDESVTTGSLACTLEALELIPGPDILTLSVNVQPSANACAFPVGSQVRAFSRVQGVTNASLLALQRDESVTTGSLACTLEALEQIHRQMFEAMQNGDGRSRGMWDAATFAKRHRASVLDGVVLLFSKCLQPLKESKLGQLREIATQCGAVCLDARPTAGAKETATHVVAMSSASEEVAWAHRTQRKVVQPLWLLCCSHTWHKVRESGLSL